MELLHPSKGDVAFLRMPYGILQVLVESELETEKGIVFHGYLLTNPMHITPGASVVFTSVLIVDVLKKEEPPVQKRKRKKVVKK